jgi:peptide/nickel transport system substrate-binding protein
MYNNLQTGTINVAMTLAPTDTQSAKSNPNLVYKQIPGLSFFGFQLNTKAAPLDNVHVRRAIAWGVNPQEIVTSVLDNIGVVAKGPVPPSSWAYSAGPGPYSYNTSNAKSELQQAGMTSASFTLLVASGSLVNSQEAQFIQQELQPAGITVNIKQETFATILSDTAAHHFQAALIGWSGRPDPDGNVYSWFHTGGGNNNMQYSSPQVDALLDDARASTDQAHRAQDYQQAEQQIVQDASYVFINYGVAIQATTKNVQNYTLLPSTIMPFEQTYLS